MSDEDKKSLHGDLEFTLTRSRKHLSETSGENVRRKGGVTPVVDIGGLYLTQGDDEKGGGASFSLKVEALTLFPGDLICLIGPSGGGKSTLLDTVALLRGAKEVERFIFWPDEHAQGLELAEPLKGGRMDGLAHFRSSALGYAPQAGGMLPFLTAWEDAMSPVALGGHIGRNEIDRLRAYAANLGLEMDLEKSRAALSGGQRKRLSLLRALARPRRFLVLDEPTSGIDEATAESALRLVADVSRQQGAACLIASHDVELARKVGFQMRELRPTVGAQKGKEFELVTEDRIFAGQISPNVDSPGVLEPRE